MYQLELVNREKNYNKIFNVSPSVGVLDPLASSKVLPPYTPTLLLPPSPAVSLTLSIYLSHVSNCRRCQRSQPVGTWVPLLWQEATLNCPPSSTQPPDLLPLMLTCLVGVVNQLNHAHNRSSHLYWSEEQETKFISSKKSLKMSEIIIIRPWYYTGIVLWLCLWLRTELRSQSIPSVYGLWVDGNRTCLMKLRPLPREKNTNQLFQHP